jgi:hypothetical protein
MQRFAAVLWLSFLLLASTGAQTAPPKFEAGAQFTAIHLADVKENTVGLGVRFVYNPFRHLSLETELNQTVTRPPFGSSSTGGQVRQGFFGAKAGLRKSKFGIFGKLRPGFVSFDDVAKSITFSPPAVQFGRRTQFALDVGGVVEIYASRHISIRYDLGDTMVFYGQEQFFPPPSPVSPGITLHNFQFSSGILFRF